MFDSISRMGAAKKHQSRPAKLKLIHRAGQADVVALLPRRLSAYQDMRLKPLAGFRNCQLSSHTVPYRSWPRRCVARARQVPHQPDQPTFMLPLFWLMMPCDPRFVWNAANQVHANLACICALGEGKIYPEVDSLLHVWMVNHEIRVGNFYLNQDGEI